MKEKLEHTEVQSAELASPNILSICQSSLSLTLSLFFLHLPIATPPPSPFPLYRIPSISLRHSLCIFFHSLAHHLSLSLSLPISHMDPRREHMSIHTCQYVHQMTCWCFYDNVTDTRIWLMESQIRHNPPSGPYPRQGFGLCLFISVYISMCVCLGTAKGRGTLNHS